MTTIYYFSGTGNSLHTAKCLQEKLNDCELLPIASLMKQESITATSEKVGFIFPIHCRALPKIVHDFVEKIDLSNTKYIFALATKGSPFKQLVMQVLNLLLQPKNKTIDAVFEIRIFSNNIFGTKGISPLPSKKKRERRIRNAESKLDDIVGLIRDNQQGKNSEIFHFALKGSYKSHLEEVNTTDEKYYSDENCNGCGICEKLCPVDNIKLVNEKPEWQHKCQQCLACLHYCPQKAIQLGEFTPGRERYNHPKIKLKELIDQNPK